MVRHEVLHVIKFLHVKGSEPAKIQNQLEVFWKQVWILCNAFINCRTGADDRQRPGRPSTSVTDDKGCGSHVHTREQKCVNVKQTDTARHLEILLANAHSTAHHQATAQKRVHAGCQRTSYLTPFLFYPDRRLLIPVNQVIFLFFAWRIVACRAETNTRSENYRFVCKWREKDITSAVNRNRITIHFVFRRKYTARTSYEIKLSLNMQAMNLTSSDEEVTIMRYLPYQNNDRLCNLNEVIPLCYLNIYFITTCFR